MGYFPSATTEGELARVSHVVARRFAGHAARAAGGLETASPLRHRHRYPTLKPRMSIQNDAWITRMAIEHQMIEPFEGRQVRTGVISYGVSSYGYDMRVAREFRIFTNVLNSIVDPKAFDPKSFVEFEGDVCIVPP